MNTDEVLYNPMQLRQRRVLITGATSGIGRATAVLLSRLGAEVICCGRHEGRLSETMNLLAGGPHRAEAFDLLVAAAIPEVLKGIVDRSGKLDCLVHAAGVQSATPLSRLAPKHWSNLWAANVESAVGLIRGYQQPDVYSGNDGSLVLISSVVTRVGSPGRSAYAATKGALEGLIPSLALELVPRKIRVNCIAPAFTKTPMYDEMERFWTPEQRAEIEAKHPLGIGKPEDVAHAVAFLVSQASRWITGTILTVDGGYSIQ